MIGRIVATVGLILANGFFVAAEFALVAVRRSRVDQLAEEGRPAARSLQRSLREVSVMLAGAQLGITVASLLLGFVAEPLIAGGIEAAIGWTQWQIGSAVVHTASFILALSAVVFLHMVFGEMVPKNFTITEPERTALALAIPFRVFVNVLRALIVVLNVLSNAGVRLLGTEPIDARRVVPTPDEISAMLRESWAAGTVPELAHRMLSGALSFRDRDAAAVMTPRPDVLAADVSATPKELEELIRREGKSRVPIYRGDLSDDVLGFVHAKDLLTLTGPERNEPLDPALVRDLLVVPEPARLLDVLREMQSKHMHIALVVDEHGGTAGVLTLEDILEELVGEIWDEYDIHEYKVWHLGQRRYLVDGSLRPDEVREATGLVLPEGEYETLGGFVFDRHGDIPEKGTVVDVGGWTLLVRAMDGFRVARVEVVGPEGAQNGGSSVTDR